MSRALNLGILVVLLLGTAALGMSIEAWRRATWRHVSFRGGCLLVSTSDGRIEESNVVFTGPAYSTFNASRPRLVVATRLPTTGAFQPNVTTYVVRQGVFRSMLTLGMDTMDPTGPGAIIFSSIAQGVLGSTDLPYHPGERLVIYGGGSGGTRLFLSKIDSTGVVNFGWVAPKSNAPSYPYPSFATTNTYVQPRPFRLAPHVMDWHASTPVS